MLRFLFYFLQLLCFPQIFALTMPPPIHNYNQTALLIVDIQNDFCAGGPLAVPNGDDVIPVINHLRSQVHFGMVIFTMDWHPVNHISFFERFASDRSKYPDAKLYEEVKFDLGDGRGIRTQRLWPIHAVQNTVGAELRNGLERSSSDIIVHKGTNPDVDSYSAFLENDGVTETELNSILKRGNIKELVLVGLAFEYCVGNTAYDGIKYGFKVTILEDAIGSLGPPNESARMTDKLNEVGVRIMSTEKFLNNNAVLLVAPLWELILFPFIIRIN